MGTQSFGCSSLPDVQNLQVNLSENGARERVTESITAATEWMPLNTGLDEGLRICAVGDVHGCSQQLQQLLDDLESRNSHYDKNILIFMGDYIDRGYDSLGAIDTVINATDRSFDECYPLMGNHEQMMRIALRAEKNDNHQLWIDNGGDSVLRELALPRHISRKTVEEFSADVGEAMGANRKLFLDTLHHHKFFGNLLFVHAGTNPKKSLEEHLSLPWDLLDSSHWVWIRYSFLFDPTGLEPMTVVHGHTPVFNYKPAISESELVKSHGPNEGKMNLDAGCFESGRLVAGEFIKDSCRLVSYYEKLTKIELQPD